MELKIIVIASNNNGGIQRRSEITLNAPDNAVSTRTTTPLIEAALMATFSQYKLAEADEAAHCILRNAEPTAANITRANNSIATRD